MEDIPPSYESAINRDAWNIIAPWIPSGTLCSAALVCRKWHRIFIPLLWGNPASHFASENDAVYIALTRFRRKLARARLGVRQLTHTLHLPPAPSDIYGGRNPAWLRDVLEYLPNLQSLLVSQLPFFDHPSLIALKNGGKARSTSSLNGNEDDPSIYGLKLLQAAREPNTTSVGIAEALTHFPRLVYLDLSYTTPARDAAVLSALSHLHDLQVLKLRGLGMRDAEAEIMASAIGLRVRVLDLRENMLTDMSVTSLLRDCFLPPQIEPPGSRTHGHRIEDWSMGMAPGPDFLSLDSLRSEELDRYLMKQLTHPLTGRLAIEDIPHRGLTHLYIADNKLSVDGLARLLKSRRLHVLDAGTVDTITYIAKPVSLSSPAKHEDEVAFDGVEKLVPVLATSARTNLTYLRISHAVVTGKLSMKEVSSPASLVAELPSPERMIAEAPASEHHPIEVPSSTERISKLSAEPAESKSDMPGNGVHFAVSPLLGHAPVPGRSASHGDLKPWRGDGAFAPEVLKGSNAPANDHGSNGDNDVVLNASGSGVAPKKYLKDRSRVGAISTLVYRPISPGLASRPAVPVEQSVLSNSVSSSHLSRMDVLLRKRPSSTILPPVTPPSAVPSTLAFQSFSQLHPSFLPNLRTLVLTDVPTTVPTSSASVERLQNFVSACADEAEKALLSAQTDYSLPPGRARHVAEAQHAQSLFALRQIVLETAPSHNAGRPLSKLQPKGWHHLRQRTNMLRSSTGDRDSENLWSAAEDDFSFFGDEDREQENECGIYPHDPDRYSPTAASGEKIVVDPEESGVDQSSGVSPMGPFPTTSAHGSRVSIDTAAPMRSHAVSQSPRNLPPGRDERSSTSTSGRPDLRTPWPADAPGMIPPPTTSNPSQPPPTSKPEEPMLDVVAELAKFRRERKAKYEDALRKWRIATLPANLHVKWYPDETIRHERREMPFVAGHWKGDITAVRNSASSGGPGGEKRDGRVWLN